MSKKGHIAFFIPHEGCPQDCSFCNQRTISGRQNLPTLEEIKTTLRQQLENLGEKALAYEIAFFGGSFTAIQKELQHKYLQAATPFCGAQGFGGIRFSTRPDAISKEVLENLQEYPVTHIELGVQSMIDDVLRKNKRGHTVADVKNAVKLLKAYEYPYTLQMMTGLDGDTIEGALFTANAIAQLQPTSVRIYPTLVLEGTELAERYQKGQYCPFTLKETIFLGAKLIDFFHKQEISVIRLGLHEEQGVKENIIAGPYHPALRELCKGEYLVSQAKSLIYEENIEYTDCDFFVSPRNISTLTGHRMKALASLIQQGYQIKVKPDSRLNDFEIRVEQSLS